MAVLACEIHFMQICQNVYDIFPAQNFQYLSEARITFQFDLFENVSES